MRVDPSAIVKQIQGIRGRGVRNVTSADGTAPDSVDFSHRAADFKTAMEALANTPEVRNDRVKALRAQILEGAYFAPVMDISRKLFGDKDV
jgi:anti-sigma28 factor (negative regulator of flagellin synthesis)